MRIDEEMEWTTIRVPKPTAVTLDEMGRWYGAEVSTEDRVAHPRTRALHHLIRQFLDRQRRHFADKGNGQFIYIPQEET